MDEKNELLQFHNEYLESFKQIEEHNDFSKKFYQSFLSGNNTLYQKYIKETKNFDEEWIKTIESYVPSLNKIVMTPKSSLRLEEDIIAIEKAKKINSQSIRHLASHTQFIKEVSEEKGVVPKKILTNYSEVDYTIYENRFVMSLIDRLFVFVRNRYDLIKQNIESFEKRKFNLESTFPVNKTNVDLKIDMVFTDEIDGKSINEYNRRLLDRVTYLNKIVTSLKASPFMEQMKNQKKVMPPIMKTNILMKDINYKNAYLLWLFLDRYNTLAFTIDIKEKNLTFSEEYYEDIYRQVLSLFTVIAANQENNKEKYQSIKEKKFRKKSLKIRTSLPEDFNLNFEDEKIEENSLNEYYLEANKRLFKQSLEYHKTNTKTYETSVKRALRDTLDISNALYASFFKLEEEDNVFKKLITDIDYSKKVNEAKTNALIAKMIREVKEVDFNNALRLEKKYLDDIVKYNIAVLKEYKEKESLSKKEAINQKKLEKEKKRMLLQKQQLNDKLKNNKKLAENANKYRAISRQKVSEFKKSKDQELKLKIREYKKSLTKKNNEVLNKFIVANKLDIKMTNERLRKEKELLNKKFLEEKARIDLKYQKKLKDSKLLFKEKNSQVLNKKLNILGKRAIQNRKNLEFLESSKTKYDQKIKDYEKTKLLEFNNSLKNSGDE
ncbi:MAG: hypothetical protein RBQ97_00580 [Acholeplasma sp.]|nr:hypothetical protein [Acholeplasma sp.]